jgi:hypothetical protein
VHRHITHPNTTPHSQCSSFCRVDWSAVMSLPESLVCLLLLVSHPALLGALALARTVPYAWHIQSSLGPPKEVVLCRWSPLHGLVAAPRDCCVLHGSWGALSRDPAMHGSCRSLQQHLRLEKWLDREVVVGCHLNSSWCLYNIFIFLQHFNISKNSLF